MVDPADSSAKFLPILWRIKVVTSQWRTKSCHGDRWRGWPLPELESHSTADVVFRRELGKVPLAPLLTSSSLRIDERRGKNRDREQRNRDSGESESEHHRTTGLGLKTLPRGSSPLAPLAGMIRVTRKGWFAISC